MFRNRLYYGIKPLLPRQIRMGIRRQLAVKKRVSVGGVWPIRPGSEKPPEGWPGWPDGKRFALVLTHDVEGPEGLDKCRSLAKLEKQLGFRSSFNFIPEGPYRITRELREELASEGFEVGVHDLQHDGKLFHNREAFNRKATRINGYLKDWGAAGFRSGFMLHNLDWLHDLNIQYDASTFDTDPFEPQPEGRNTIFPFWVPRPDHGTEGPRTTERGEDLRESGRPVVPSSGGPSSGYVELPYTLPQDSTLFLLLREKTPEIWIQKLDWIAKYGGMALVNVHPDYVRFEGGARSSGTYDVTLYVRFLEHVQKCYGGAFWQPLAKELAVFVSREKPLAGRTPRRVCMVTYSHFISDARVKRYAESLAERGDQVDVVALRRAQNSPSVERIGNINLVRLQSRLGKNETSPVSFLLPVLRFFVASSLWITRQHFRERYDLLHIHNIPDFLVFAGWYPKLTGTKVILDIHDIVPEFYTSKFKVPEGSMTIRMLKWIERAAAAFAHHVIISNHLWHDKYVARTRTEGHCSVFINNVDTQTFQPRPRTRQDGKIVILFPGGLQWHQGLDIAIRAFKRISPQFPQAEFHIYGDGNMKESLVALTQKLGLIESVRFFDPRPVNEIAEIMANADLGVVPKRADSFGNEAYSTKIMEFMSVGVPVVVSSTRIDRYYFDDSLVRFFESGNDEAMAAAMTEILTNDSLRKRSITNALAYAGRNSWEVRKADYLHLVDSLLNEAPAPSLASPSGIPKPTEAAAVPATDLALK